MVKLPNIRTSAAIIINAINTLPAIISAFVAFSTYFPPFYDETEVGSNEDPILDNPLNTNGIIKYPTKIQTIGAQYGTSTGRPRPCGWFDTLVAKYAVLVSGITQIALTKIDVFDSFDEIKLCTAYRDVNNGKVYKTYPTNISLHKHLEPIYETFDGWKEDISKITNYKDLPSNLIKYIKRIEEIVGVKVNIISVGPKREQTIILKKPF